MGLVLIKERRILFREFALSKYQYLYNKLLYLRVVCIEVKIHPVGSNYVHKRLRVQ